MSALLRAGLVVWLAVSVAACGFQLRGSMDWPEPWPRCISPV